MSEVKYKRVLLKLSGEALQDTQYHQILQATTLKNAACAVKKMVANDREISRYSGLAYRMCSLYEFMAETNDMGRSISEDS